MSCTETRGTPQPDQFFDRLGVAREIADDLVRALKARRADKSTTESFWESPGSDSIGWQESWRGPSPVDSEALVTVATAYLKTPWLQDNLVDSYLLNGFLFDTLAKFREGVLSGESVFGLRSWSWELAEGKPTKFFLYRMGFGLLKSTLRWLLCPAVIVYLLYIERTDLVPWVAVPYGLYLAAFLLFFPIRIWRRYERKKQYAKFAEVERRLVAVYETVKTSTFSPRHLLDQLREAEGVGASLPPVVYALVERAINRDPAVFAV